MTTTTAPLSLRFRSAIASLYALAATLATTAGMVVLGVGMAVGLLVVSVGTTHAEPFVPRAHPQQMTSPTVHSYPASIDADK